MKFKVFYLCLLVFASCNNVSVSGEESKNGLFSRAKRQVYNYFYGSDGYGNGDDCYVNECGYISSGSNSYMGSYNNHENFIEANSFPVQPLVM